MSSLTQSVSRCSQIRHLALFVSLGREESDRGQLATEFGQRRARQVQAHLVAVAVGGVELGNRSRAEVDDSRPDVTRQVDARDELSGTGHDGPPTGLDLDWLTT